jgi:thiol-disulfide isomerase/thioredoxin
MANFVNIKFDQRKQTYNKRKMNKLKNIAAALLLIGASAASASAAPYRLTVSTTDDDDGAMAFLVNADNGSHIDSVIVADCQAQFTGDIDETITARIFIDGERRGTFFLEPGTIVFDSHKKEAVGSPLNDASNAYDQQAEAIVNRYRAADNDEARQAIYDEYMAFVNKIVEDNADNQLGLAYFLSELSNSVEDLDAYLAKHPEFEKSQRVQKLRIQNQRRLATQPGNKFIDFEITYNGETKRLSDYVGKGQFVLVDFWASWCGPCIRQTAVIKDLYNQYKDQGLKVLGIAVWDEPENTLKAIKQHELPWECILNAQTIPTDLYGISGIPCIILFGPDGTILSRDKQDDALRADVTAALQQK